MRPLHRDRRSVITLLVVACAASAWAQRATPVGAQGAADVNELLHRYEQRIEFVENKGQFASPVLFKADLPLGQAIATPEGMYMKAYDAEAVRVREAEGMRIEQDMHDGKPMRPLVWHEKGHGWLMRFQNALPTMRVSQREAHAEVSNYFLGGKDALGVHSYQEVWYTGVYRGVDVRYYPAADGTLEYDVICAPGSDPSAIAIELQGISGARVNANGELVLPTSLGDMVQPVPMVYQRVGGKEKRVKAAYRIRNGNVLGFTLGDYDKSRPLVIDPIAMRWATWVNTNSTGDNHGHCIWVDPSDGAIYVVARVVGSTDNITVGAFDQTANGNLEMVVGKYTEPAAVGGSGVRVWQTYIGGGGDDNPYAMEQGPDGNLYITGQTGSTNFPLIGGSAFSGTSIDQQAQADIDVFVLKINTAGNSIKAAVVGGNGADDSYDLRTAANGDVFVCGSTTSSNLLTLNASSGASNTNNGGSDALVFRIDQDLSSLVWMRNYGGLGTDRASIMLHDPATGDLFVGGNTSSTNFPTASPRQSTRGGNSAGFLQRLTGAGATTWSSYFSSASGQDASVLCMEFNDQKNVLYIGGVTTGLNAANISGAYDATANGSNDLYVARMGTDQSFLSGTYVGGTGNEVNMMGLNTDKNNDVFVFGYTNSTNFPVTASPNVPLQSTNQGNNDKVFFKLKSDLSALLFSTYYGGTADDYDPVGERGIKFNDCRIYTIVTAQSNNIPLTQGALNTTKVSSTSRYEPGLVVWANPPDLLGNTINYQGTAICAGSVPGDILGSQPNYTLPTVVRNNASSSYPAFPSAATYQWQVSLDSTNWNNIPGATGQNLLGSQIGVVNQTTYIRRIIGGDACILAGAADQVVTVRLMSVTGSLTQPLCNGDANGSIMANANGLAPFTYAWSNGQSGQTATGLAAGGYSVTVTDANGCQASNQFVLGQPTVLGGSANVTAATCGNANGSATASGNGGTPGYTYLWSTGTLGATLSGVPAGNYSVTITDGHGCTHVLDVSVPGSGAVSANAGDDAVITCLNNGQVVLHGSSSPGVSFAWSGPGIVSGGGSADVTVNAAGTYVLTVTDQQSGCSNTDQAQVTVNNTAPGAQASGGALDCNNANVELQGSGNGTFSWSGPSNYSSNDQNPTVNIAGTYVLTVTGQNGCTSTANAEVTSDFHTPTAFVGFFFQPNCTNPTTTLTGNSDEPNVSFAWSGPNNFSSNDQSITVSAAGTYTLTVKGANGCTGTATANVIPNTTPPTAIAFGGTLTCSEPSVMLQAFGNGSFAWSGPNNFSSSDQNPTVSVAGIYVLTVTGENGCTNTAQAMVGLDNGTPGAQAIGGTLDCNNASVILQGSGNGTFIWSGPNNFSSNDQNPTVNVAGTYVLTVTGQNGCTSTASAQVGLDNEVPGAQATGGILDCNNASVMLQGSGNGSFSWSGPNSFTSNDQNPTVDVTGTYVLTVTGQNGCTSTANAEVGSDFHTPTAFVGFFFQPNCVHPTTTLTGNSDEPNVSFAWSGPNNFSSNDQSITVSAAGTYTLTVKGANGCTGTATANVIPNTTPPTAIAFGGTLTCSENSVMLQAFGNGSFSWSGPNNFASTEEFPVVSVVGTYVLTVTGENGCTNTAQAQVDQDNDLPGAEANGGTITCANTSVMLQGAGNGSFSWSGPNNYSSNQQNPTVNVAGTYVLTVTGQNGCASTASAEVGLDNEVPGAQATGGILDCNNANVELQGSGNGTFGWSGPNNFTSNDQNPTVSVVGTYVLTVTGENGCTSTANAEVGSDFHTPTAYVGFFFQPNCANPTTTLTGNSDEPNVSFAWSGPNNFSSNDQSITVSAAGTYTLTVKGANGCTGTATANVVPSTTLPTAIAFGGTLTCSEPSVMLQAFGNGSFEWSGPNNFASTEQFPVVNVAGTYVLTVTGENGCTNTAQAQVDQDNSVPGAQATGGTITCANTSVMLQGSGNGNFSWSGPGNFSSNDQNPTVSAAGTYVLTVTGENGCTSVAQTSVELDIAAPGANAIGGTLTCTNTTLQLQGSGNGNYAWSGPNNFTSNDQNPTVSVEGAYHLTVTGANGCTSQADAVVQRDVTVPVAIAYGGTLTCAQEQVTLNGIGTGSLAWVGPGNFQSSDANPMVSVAGLYVLTVTGDNGCSATATAEVTEDNAGPEASALGGLLPCDGSGFHLSAITGNDVSITWTGPNGFSSNVADPVVFGAGNYVLTVVSNISGCRTVVEVVVGTQECGHQCPPVIIDCPQAKKVECGTNLDPDVIGYPELRKDPNCPPIVYGTYHDEVTGVCPRIVSRYWTIADNAGDTSRCTQVFIIEDTHAPVIMGVPADMTVECGQVPDKEPDVWAEDDCKALQQVEVTDLVTPGDCPGYYTITRTYWAVDDCGNLGTATQTITVTDHTAPVLECAIPDEITVMCGNVPAGSKCKAHDDCDDDVPVQVSDEYVKDKDAKECMIIRTYSATDDCGNTTTFVQTIHLLGDCCGKKPEVTPKPFVKMDVAPNPFREECRMRFTATGNGNAVVRISDANGRPVAEPFRALVKEGQPVEFIFHAEGLQRGVYQYQLIMAGGEAHGRIVVQ